MNDQDVLIAEAEIGDEARRFLESDLGKTLLGMAKQEIQAAQEALEETDPTDTKTITALQNKAKVGRNFEQWLNELLIRGENALNTWKQQQEESNA